MDIPSSTTPGIGPLQTDGVIRSRTCLYRTSTGITGRDCTLEVVPSAECDILEVREYGTSGWTRLTLGSTYGGKITIGNPFTAPIPAGATGIAAQVVGGAWVHVSSVPLKARWIVFNYNPGSPTVSSLVDWWDGVNPLTCGSVTVNYPLGEPCQAAKVAATYDPENDVYQAISTESAMLGPPKLYNLTGSDMSWDGGCGIDITPFAIKAFAACPEDSAPLGDGEEPIKLNAPVTVKTAVTGAYWNGCDLVYTHTSFNAFGGCVGGSSVPANGTVTPPRDVTIMNVLTGCEIVRPTGYTCEGSCQWEWDSEAEEWKPYGLASGCSGDCNCPAPVDPWTTGPTIVTVTCVRHSTPVTGIVFNAATVSFCGTVTSGAPCVLLATECPAEPPPG